MIVLEIGAKVLPQESVAVQVSFIVPPQAEGGVEKVDRLEVPLIKHAPLKPLVNVSVLGSGKAPQATVMLGGGLKVGKVAGLTVIVLDCVIVLPKASVNVQVSTIVPPQDGFEPFVGVKLLNVEVTLPLIAQVPEVLFE